MNNLIIGIAGGSGSGKTTLSLRLKERFGRKNRYPASECQWHDQSVLHNIGRCRNEHCRNDKQIQR